MKIMKVFDKKIGETTYEKYRINLPKKIVEESKLVGKELIATIEGNRIILRE